MSVRKGNILISGKGLDGTNGVSPTATVNKVGDTTIFTVTDINGTTTTQIFDGEKVQYSTLPTASVDNLGKIVQYTGVTDSTYTNGYYYQVVSDEEETPTYSWENIQVQESSGSSFNYISNSITSSMDAMNLNLVNYLNGIGVYKFSGMEIFGLNGGNGATRYKYRVYGNVFYIIKDYATANGGDYIGFCFTSDEDTSTGIGMLFTNIWKARDGNGVYYSRDNVGQRQFDLVLKYGNQSISGVKTFSTLPESSVTPTSDNQLTNKKYVDDSINNSGFITSETDPIFSASAASEISSNDISNWNAKGTYSKPNDGIPKTDLDSGVQASLDKADTALQTHQTITSNMVTSALGYTPYNSTNPNGYTSNTGTITGITMNGSSKGTSGVVNLGTVLTSHQDISGKQDKLTASTGITIDSSNNISVNFGTTASTACAGNDSRLSNSRTPTSHRSTGTSYGVGNATYYGHCRVIDNLTTSSHTDGYALSAYQGYLLKELINNYIPVTLYENNEGSTDTITLSNSSANYTYLEIFFKSNENVFNSVKVYNPNGKRVSLISQWTNNGTPAVYLKTRVISIDGTSISSTTANVTHAETTLKANTAISMDSSNTLAITRVLGYKL